mgnify:CR=1 FL=1
MAAMMISLLLFKGRRGATLVCFGAACLMVMVSPLSLRWSWLCCWAPCFTLAGCCLAPDSLNSRTPMAARPPHQGEMYATIRGVGFRHATPVTPEHRVTGRIWPCPPSRAITRRRTRCQSDRKDSLSPTERAPQLTRTDPSQTVYPLQPGAPVGPEQNHRVQDEPAAELERNRTASRQCSEPAAAAEAVEQGNTERPAGTSDDSASPRSPWDQCQCYYYEEASAWAPRDPSNRTDPGAGHGSGEPFSM